MKWPPVAHLLAAAGRFSTRLGPQFAGAITYFSVLSLVPILMFSFAMLGMVLTVLRPDLLAGIQVWVEQALGGVPGDNAQSIKGVIDNALSSWKGIGLTALLMAGYSGSGWVGNLKMAVRMMWREVAVDEENSTNPVVNVLGNMVIFLGLIVCVILVIAVAQFGWLGSSWLIGVLQLDGVPGIGLLFSVVSFLLNFLVAWILVAFLFLTLPGERVRSRVWLVGVTMGALLITILQQLAGVITSMFSSSPAASVFGSLILLMLLMNLLATVLLFCAAWIGTDPQRRPDVSGVRAKAAEMAANRAAVARAFAEPTGSQPPEELVKQSVAERGVRAGLKVGYGVGAATGLGAGALLAATASAFSRLFGRR